MTRGNSPVAAVMTIPTTIAVATHNLGVGSAPGSTSR